jgi:uncharacterized protein YndB with AHSA1/START domain
MSQKWEKTFEIAVPVDRVWEAVTNRETLQVLLSPPPGQGIPTDHDGGTGIELLEAVPLEKLRWSQPAGDPPQRAEFTIVFESREVGCSIAVTRFGFGEGEDADIFSVSNGLGWEHGFRDLVMYLETGQMVKRHYNGCTRSCLGLSYVETAAGIQVCRVGEKGVGADAGLQRGDRIVRIAGVPIYTRADVWTTNGFHDPGTPVEVEFIRGRELLRATGRTAPLSERLVGE